MKKNEIIEMIERNGYKVAEGTTNKNGIIYESIRITGTQESDEELKIQPTIRISEVENMTEEEITTMIKNALDNSFNVSEITNILRDSDYIKNNIIVVANKSSVNKISDLFQHDETLNIDYYIRVLLSLNSDTASITLHKNMIEETGFSEKELWDIAQQNTDKSIHVKSMLETILDIVPDINEDIENLQSLEDENEIKMLVACNDSRSFGAGILRNRKFFMDFAKKNNIKKFVVLPSSIHELIFIIGDTDDTDTLNKMVTEVNDTQVLPEEVLANRAFTFSTTEGFY